MADAEDWSTVRDRLERRTAATLDSLTEEWGPAPTTEPFEYGPLPWHPSEPPGSVEGQLDVFGGMASVVTFYSPDREEAVLVYHRGGYWEPPGGAIEGAATPAETARAEAHEEAGLDVELTDLLATGRVLLAYEDGSTAPLPVVTFAGHRVEGSLRVEREVNDHPGVTRGVGLFGAEVLPENCRDRERILALLADGE